MLLLSLPARLFSGLAALVIVFSGVQLYGLIGISRTAEEFQLLKSFHLNFIFQLQSLETSQSSLLLLLKSLTDSQGKSSRRTDLLKKWIRLTRDKREVAFRRVNRLVKARIQNATGDELSYLNSSIVTVINGIKKDIEDLKTRFIELYSSENEIPQSRVKYLSRREHVIMSKIKKLVTVSRSRIMAVASMLEKSEQSTIDSQVILLIFSLVLSIFVLFTTTTPMRYLKYVTQGAAKLGKGEYNAHIDVKTNDEIGALAEEFNKMGKALQERENRLIQTERLAAAGKLASQIAHEIRNPLASVSFQVEILADMLSDSALTGAEKKDAQDSLVALSKEVDRLSGITDGYLEFARMPKPVFRKVNLIEYLTEVLDFVEGDLALNKITFDNEFGSTEIYVDADEDLLKQVFLNLFRNSADAMPEGGKITIGIHKEENLAVIRISDSGEGVPEKNLSRIFDAFYTTKKHGTGLGLSLCKQIIEDHGGEILVESTSEVGTTFYIKLPERANQS
ncbi:MAG: HAMP domain-containing protein [Deltaproteobacteria bacterium]|nr:HAMP domain-containing protein [Deltaproteobacteria bacterium]